MKVIFSIDAETMGLYGEPFAIGYIVTDLEGNELEGNYIACPFEKAQGLESNKKWVAANVLPNLPKETDFDDPHSLCEALYEIWLNMKQKYEEILVIGDCHYPVETQLFERTILWKEDVRQWTGPFPFHEVDTALLIAGIDREQYPRNELELPEHHPLKDARYSARLFCLALKKTELLRRGQ
jgi:hypothetical protein